MTSETQLRIQREAEAWTETSEAQGCYDMGQAGQVSCYIAGAIAEREYIEKIITNVDGENHLQWIYDRMAYVMGENVNMDYMRKFKSIIEALKSK